MFLHRSIHIIAAFTFLALSSVLGGCATYQSHENRDISVMIEKDVGDVDQDFIDRVMVEPPRHQKLSRRDRHLTLEQKVELEIQNKVAWWIRYYCIREREIFQRNLDRGENYRPLVQQILSEYQLPPELYYLAMIESGYVTHAKSAVAAVGIWQFMVPTARNYKLVVDVGYDQRSHPIAATHAAAHYLTNLHKEFNSWYLAIAAYNAGQGRIRHAIKRGRTNDFWQLAVRKLIPQETMDYIPKFLAAATIGSNLSKFAFENLPPKQPWPEIASIDLKPGRKGLKLKDIAKKAAMTEKEVLRFNPQLNHALTHLFAHKKIRIWLPKESIERFYVVSRNGQSSLAEN